MLQYAHVHSPMLKTACFEFIKKDTDKALIDPGMMGLAVEDPALGRTWFISKCKAREETK